jgi:hypothetical protein
MAASDLERGKRIGGGSHILVNRRPGPHTGPTMTNVNDIRAVLIT